MRIDKRNLFTLVQFSLLFFELTESVRNYRLESQLGSTILLPPCLSTSPSTSQETNVSPTSDRRPSTVFCCSVPVDDSIQIRFRRTADDERKADLDESSIPIEEQSFGRVNHQIHPVIRSRSIRMSN